MSAHCLQFSAPARRELECHVIPPQGEICLRLNVWGLLPKRPGTTAFLRIGYWVSVVPLPQPVSCRHPFKKLSCWKEGLWGAFLRWLSCAFSVLFLAAHHGSGLGVSVLFIMPFLS